MKKEKKCVARPQVDLNIQLNPETYKNVQKVNQVDNYLDPEFQKLKQL
jgi:hypothetical protein